MKFDVITIFPFFFNSFLDYSIIKRAQIKKKIKIEIHDLRNYSQKRHQQIDDTPYGGDVGMLLSFPPLLECLQQIPKTTNQKVILLSPQGKVFHQKKAFQYVQEFDHLIFICGHYEGVDARILEYVDEELSIGDYVLTGGEIAACVAIDAVTRLVPGVINQMSYLKDSHQNGLLKYSQYTKPQSYKEHTVPKVLLSGHHQNIFKWRQKDSLKNTLTKRSDLLEKAYLDDEMQKILEKIKQELLKEEKL